MVKVYYDADADLKVISDKTIAVVGYGNQGRAQALNMRDSGLNVIVGSIRDESWDRAVEDGFKVYPISRASELAEIILFLLPDEVQPEVYNREVKENLSKGKALVFAHGYTIHYGFIKPPRDVDILLLAPRMIGTYVRELFQRGSGAPAFISVGQDASGEGLRRVLALAKAIGATRVGVMELSFAEEAELDHFSEHYTVPVIFRAIQLGFEALVEEGYTPEAVLLEMYASGELAEVFRAAAKMGLYKQMSLHSTTSQYGTLTYSSRVMPDSAKGMIKEVIREIKTGRFAREWQLEQQAGYPMFRRLKEEALRHPINEVEERLRRMIRIEL
ncbi:MAG: ketol-acid reductoisomerase [Candidatus Bathyarchaeia archaeon]|nr:ketol-acid reductoisomerase [Candidatus Bathyarchaeota archaeon]